MSETFVIALENRVGELGRVACALERRGVALEQLAGKGTGARLCGRIATRDGAVTREVLEALGVPYISGEALHVETEDLPDAVGKLTRPLREAGIAVGDTLVVGRRDGRIRVALGVPDATEAWRALVQEGER